VVYPQGDWYGYITARNAEQLLDSYLVSHTILAENFRGRMVCHTFLSPFPFRNLFSSLGRSAVHKTRESKEGRETQRGKEGTTRERSNNTKCCFCFCFFSVSYRTFCSFAKV
jgi:hypothetical protein